LAQISDSVNIQVVPVLRRLRISPEEVKINSDQNFQFQVTGFDQQEDFIKPNYIEWDATGGTINQNGYFVPSASSNGSYEIYAEAIPENIGDLAEIKIVRVTQQPDVYIPSNFSNRNPGEPSFMGKVIKTVGETIEDVRERFDSSLNTNNPETSVEQSNNRFVDQKSSSDFNQKEDSTSNQDYQPNVYIPSEEKGSPSVAGCKIECIESNTDTDLSQYGKFVLEPLERGQGTTVGNALKRVLLSNLEGAAITSVRVAGVNHEFATIQGVREDVLEILLNLKEVVLKSYTHQKQIGRLLVQGPATVTAGHFDLPSEVEVVDKNQYIATLAPGATLEMEFQIEKGCGYRAVERSYDATAVDFLQIDAVFMPVRKVNYTVEEARVGGYKEKDRLIMEIWTNGSYTPQEAIAVAATILVDLFTPLKDITLESIKSDQNNDVDPMSQIPIEELQLSVQAYNCLKRAQIKSVADLRDYTQEDLLEIKNFSQKSAEEVIEALQKRLGIILPQERASKSEDITPESIKSDQNDDIDPMSQIPIEELQLSVRAYNCLKRAQINSVADLRDYTQEDLLEIKNFGQKNAEEVIEVLQKRLGITLPKERASKSVTS
jgi:DNA-directed RNA polymerase alpha subunit